MYLVVLIKQGFRLETPELLAARNPLDLDDTSRWFSLSVDCCCILLVLLQYGAALESYICNVSCTISDTSISVVALLLHLCIFAPSSFFLRLRREEKDNRKLLNAMAGFIILDQQAFNVVEAESFTYLLNTASRGGDWKCPSRYEVKTRIGRIAEEAVKRLREVLRGTQPAITTDNWTANNGVSGQV